LVEGAGFAVHDVVFEFFDGDGFEGSHAAVEGDPCNPDGAIAEAFQQFGREMESGGGGGDGAGDFGVHGLVPLEIGRAGQLLPGAMNIRGEGRTTEAVQEKERIFEGDGFDSPDSLRLFFEDGQSGGVGLIGAGFAEMEDFAGFDSTGVFEEAAPVVVFRLPEEEAFDGSAGMSAEVKAGGNHFAVVENEAIVLSEVVQDIFKRAMVNLSGFSVHHQQSGGGAVGQRILGDELMGEFIIEH